MWWGRTAVTGVRRPDRGVSSDKMSRRELHVDHCGAFSHVGAEAEQFCS